jgi:2-polyprenyl-3-methyl-5-hydroxy-6-metoxy-1,4-benzoquinol methylase
MTMKKGKKASSTVKDHYNATIDISRDQYNVRALKDPSLVYPANYFRLKLLVNSFKKKKIKKVFEVGVGEGTPLIELADAGMDVRGFDIAPAMVDIAKENFQKHGMEADRIFWGDIQKPASYKKGVIGHGTYDGLMAMGVMPHVENDEQVLKNMAAIVKKGGTLFIEFRNSLFSLFTQNRYSAEFILDELLKGVDPKMKKIVETDLRKRLRMDLPRARLDVKGSKAPGYDAILSKFHNPFEVVPMFERLGLKDIKLLWYHYHPAMPYLQEKNPKLFLSESVKLEGEKSNWRGYFLCSAFVVEATKR